MYLTLIHISKRIFFSTSGNHVSMLSLPVLLAAKDFAGNGAACERAGCGLNEAAACILSLMVIGVVSNRYRTMPSASKVDDASIGRAIG